MHCTSLQKCPALACKKRPAITGHRVDARAVVLRLVGVDRHHLHLLLPRPKARAKRKPRKKKVEVVAIDPDETEDDGAGVYPVPRDGRAFFAG